ncbi:MAG: hypothetical protein WDM80_03480 [Limisphaerales bacterium]
MLRAYAKKRRADAGDPLKLHPATRRLLQGEVARKKPRSNRPNRPDDEEAMSVSLLELFRQRWALLTSFALVVFFGAALFLPALSKAKRKAASITAMNNLKQIGVAAQMAANENYGKLPASLETLTNGLASDKILTDPQTGKPFVYVAGGERLDVLSSNAVLAYSPENKKTHTVLFADGRVEIVNGAKFSELTNRVVTEFVLARGSAPRQLAEPQATVTVAAGNVVAAPSAQSLSKAETDRSREALSDTVATTTGTGMLAVNSPAPAASASAGLAKDFGAQTGSIQFAATQDFNSSTQNSFKNTRAPAKAASVLANFQVQQAGNAIRVVDSDGSVYDGELQPENEKKEQIPAGTLQAPGERAKTIARRDEPQMTQNSQAAQNYFFRVTGTNLTLKQNVVFAGNVVANSKAGQNQQQAYDNKGAAGGAQSQSMLKNQLLWSNSRIAGTAVVANTNNIEINAEPQSP